MVSGLAVIYCFSGLIDHPKCPQGQFGAQFLAQGHFNLPTGGLYLPGRSQLIMMAISSFLNLLTSIWMPEVHGGRDIIGFVIIGFVSATHNVSELSDMKSVRFVRFQI